MVSLLKFLYIVDQIWVFFRTYFRYLVAYLYFFSSCHCVLPVEVTIIFFLPFFFENSLFVLFSKKVNGQFNFSSILSLNLSLSYNFLFLAALVVLHSFSLLLNPGHLNAKLDTRCCPMPALWEHQMLTKSQNFDWRVCFTSLL